MEPDFVEILSLHSKINNASPSKVRKMVIRKFTGNMVKELLLIYLNFFFTPSNKSKCFNANHSNSSIHLSILKASTKKFRKTKLFKHSSIFNKLPQLLLSQCISFLHQKNRAKLCRVNLFFLKSASQSIAKYHLKITNKFIQSEVIKEPHLFNYNNVGSLQIYPYLTHYGPKTTFLRGKVENYKANLLKITSKPLTSYISNITNKCTILNGEIINKNIKYADNVTVKAIRTYLRSTAKSILLKAKSIRAEREYYLNHRYLWINPCAQDLNIKSCLLTKSNLLHLDLLPGDFSDSYLNDLDEYHPIYWLWNIPTLQSCKLVLTLPIAKQFESQCNNLLSSANMINKAKKQKDFKTLNIEINLSDSTWGHRSNQTMKLRKLKHNKYCLIDYATFLRYIFKLYPNLTWFKCKVLESCDLRTAILDDPDMNIMEMDGFELTNVSFKSLQHINISVFTAKNATHLLSTLTAHKQLQTLKINILIPDLDTNNKVNDTNNWRYGYYYMTESINDLVDDMCQFLQNQSKNLYYFSMSFEDLDSMHKCLSKTYWNPYHKYLQFILKMIENGNGFDGYLEFMLPNCEPIAWNKINIGGSLKIAQLLSNIQTIIHQNNQLLQDSTSLYEKKLVLDMPELRMYAAHKNFLKFWFNNKFLYDEDSSKFIMY